jgi:hypothetical protein
MATKLNTITIQVTATVEVDYSKEELEKLGGDFRTMKAGIERVIKQDLLPSFQEDPHCRVHLGTIAFPTSHKLKTLKGKK